MGKPEQAKIDLRANDKGSIIRQIQIELNNEWYTFKFRTEETRDLSSTCGGNTLHDIMSGKLDLAKAKSQSSIVKYSVVVSSDTITRTFNLPNGLTMNNVCYWAVNSGSVKDVTLDIDNLEFPLKVNRMFTSDGFEQTFSPPLFHNKKVFASQPLHIVSLIANQIIAAGSLQNISDNSNDDENEEKLAQEVDETTEIVG